MDKLIPPKGNVVTGKQIPNFQQILGIKSKNVGPVVQLKKPAKSGPKLVRVKVPNPKFESEKISYQKLNAMAELEDDIGEVLDGKKTITIHMPDKAFLPQG